MEEDAPIPFVDEPEVKVAPQKKPEPTEVRKVTQVEAVAKAATPPNGGALPVKEKAQAPMKEKMVYKKKEPLQPVSDVSAGSSQPVRSEAPRNVGELTEEKENSSLLMNQVPASTQRGPLSESQQSSSEMEKLQVTLLQKEVQIMELQKKCDLKDRQIHSLKLENQ
mmetsp:Transcript_9715/g.16355  ORF Transcript_9715/g.16355 Transcript_9715/m.16355 type:complete len:166 (+) Transcript_9715:2054-2551(+)